MNDEQAKSLGLRALALGMPWTEGLMDGSWVLRVGCYDPVDDPAWEYGSEPHQTSMASWPDFRDPVTEAWLVAWAGDYVQKYSHNAFIARLTPLTNKAEAWIVWRYDGVRGNNYAQSKTRAEAWLNALEKLRGGK